MQPQKIKASELKLADVVEVNNIMTWNRAIVKQVTPTEVTFFRPHGVTADFSYTGGVICYLGIEEFTVPAADFEYTVLERKELK